MADCYAHQLFGDITCIAGSPSQVLDQVSKDMADMGRLVPLQIETPKTRHADDLYQVLSDLVSMAKMGVPICCFNTYLAAIRNAEQLLEKIDQESTEDADHAKQTD